MILALLLAQVIVPTPIPIRATPTPAPISERALIARGLDDASAKAKALGATLGAVVIDLTNGSSAQVEGDRSLPMDGMQNVLIAVRVYQRIDEGKLPPEQPVRIGDPELLSLAGGADAVNAWLRELGYDGIFVAANDEGFAKPLAFAQFVSDLQAGKLLHQAAQSTLLETLAKSGSILATAGHRFVIVAMLQGGRADETARAAVLAAVGRAAYDAAMTFAL